MGWGAEVVLQVETSPLSPQPPQSHQFNLERCEKIRRKISMGQGSIGEVDVELIDATCEAHDKSLQMSDYDFWFSQKNTGTSIRAG